jgi:histidine triad (HIT) family protein
MSDDKTIFEQIIDGEIPSFTVYEDETTYAFLDANPLAPGHTLVIPKEPYDRFNEMPADVAGEIFGIISDLAPAVEAAVGADASTVALNNGPVAGQEVPHVHWHIIPRFADDDVGPIHRLFDGADLDDDEMERIASDIRNEQ